MKPILFAVRIVVGLLFIFSGLVKANDPYGLSYKMQEFFEVWNTTWMNDWSLTLSVVMNAFEIVAGVALIIGWRLRLFAWLLLLMILFFTFLTGYAYLAKNPDGSAKFRNCGCFGDCLPITPYTSFLKDIALTALIGLLFIFRKKIKPLFSEKISLFITLLATVLSFGMQWYVMKHLPFVDCLPYRKGNNIPEQMKMPANAVPDSTVITFVYKKAGQPIEFTADKFPADFNDSLYQFVKRYDKVVKKGKNNLPPINGFVLSTMQGTDTTQAVLQQDGYILLLFAVALDKKPANWHWNNKAFGQIKKIAGAKPFPLILVTSDATPAVEGFAAAGWTLPVLKCDAVAIKSAARVMPALYVLKKGTVMGKWAPADFDKALAFIQKL